MNAEHTYIVVATIVFIFLFILWHNEDPINLLFRLGCSLMAFVGSYLIFTGHMLW